MRRFIASIGLTLAALTLGAPAAVAQQSAHYMMVDDYGNFANVDPSNSNSYQQNNSGQTWYEGEGVSPHFMVSGTELGGTSSSSSSSGGGTGGGTSGGGGSNQSGGGGHHAAGGETSSAGNASSSAHPTSGRSSSARPVSGQSSSSSMGGAQPGGQSAYASSEAGWTAGGERMIRELIGVGQERSAHPDTQRYSFFNAIDGVYPAPCDTGRALEARTFLEGYWLLLLCIAVAAGALACKHKRVKKYLRKKRNRTLVYCLLAAFAGALLALTLMTLPGNAFAENNTVPSLRIYKGNLFDTSGHPITTAVDLRFSYWDTSDYVSADTTATGAINTGSSHYLGWYETHTATPNVNGAFSVVLGAQRSLVNLQTISQYAITHLHLQVEVKSSGAPDTDYEVLDINTSSSTIDRSQILAVPLARNADLLDQHDTGTGASNVPVLDGSGKLPVSTIPAGTNLETFALDADGTGTGNITLQFGSGLSKRLQYDTANSRFNFLSSVYIQGDLTVTGTINGIDFGALQSSTGALKATRGTGLNLNVSAGSYRLNGTVTNYLGASGISLAASQTNYVFFGSGGLTTRTSGFPTDESYIPVAEVTTDGSGITALADRRVLNSDDRESNVEKVYYPEYEHSSYQGDGADNVGQLTVGFDDTNKKNFYEWTSTRPTLQDYDIVLKAHLPADFTRWQAGGPTNALAVEYRSTTASNGINKADVQVYDTNGVPVTLSGSVSGLASTTWATSGIEFGSATWTPDQDFVIKVHVSAKDGEQMQLGALKLRFVQFRKP